MQIIFIGKISRHGKDRYYIQIPIEVLEKHRKIIEKWNEEGKLLVIEVKELSGMTRR